MTINESKNYDKVEITINCPHIDNQLEKLISFPFTRDATLAVITTGVLTYIVVIVVIFMGNQKSATEINAVIARNKGGSSIG